MLPNPQKKADYKKRKVWELIALSIGGLLALPCSG